MDAEHIEGPDGLRISLPRDDEYRTCSVCGGDCEPEPTVVEGFGVRVAFVCPEHGAHSMVDPFSDLR